MKSATDIFERLCDRGIPHADRPIKRGIYFCDCGQEGGRAWWIITENDPIIESKPVDWRWQIARFRERDLEKFPKSPRYVGTTTRLYEKLEYEDWS